MAVASFIDFCSQHRLAQPPDKIVKNLCTFLCQDIENTPAFVYTRQTSGILSFQAVFKPPSQRNGKENAKDKSDGQPADDVLKARLSRRGAGLAFDQLSIKFGPRLLEVIPAMWHSMAGGLLSACATSKPRSSFNRISVLTRTAQKRLLNPMDLWLKNLGKT